MELEEYPGDVIVIRKSWLAMAGLAVVFFIIGGLSGFVFGVFAYSQGLNASPAVGTVTVAQGDAIAQQSAPQPSVPPSRIDNVNTDDDPFIGIEGAPVVIVEFSDYECPFCARFQQDTLEPLLAEFGDDIQFVYRDFPISQIHPNAQEAAEAAECADAQGAFWDYHDLLFANQQLLDRTSLIRYASQLNLDVDAFTECLESGLYRDEVLADLDEGRSYGVTGTPTFFINGQRVVGAQPLATFQAIIRAELEN